MTNPEITIFLHAYFKKNYRAFSRPAPPLPPSVMWNVGMAILIDHVPWLLTINQIRVTLNGEVCLATVVDCDDTFEETTNRLIQNGWKEETPT